MTNRSSNARIWKLARTSMAMALYLRPARLPRSISSATSRLSASPSHTPETRTFSPP